MRISDWSSDVCSSDLLEDALWLPSEEQLREMLRSAFRVLRRLPDTYEVEIVAGGETHVFAHPERSEEHTSELQSLMRISYAVFCLKNKQTTSQQNRTTIM